jgi:hypothetical protein
MQRTPTHACCTHTRTDPYRAQIHWLPLAGSLRRLLRLHYDVFYTIRCGCSRARADAGVRTQTLRSPYSLRTHRMLQRSSLVTSIGHPAIPRACAKRCALHPASRNCTCSPHTRMHAHASLAPPHTCIFTRHLARRASLYINFRAKTAPIPILLD